MPSAVVSPLPLPSQTMDRPSFAPLRCAFFAAVITLAQVAMAVVSIAPKGPLWFRYTTLIQHDSYWFANIVNRGYDTTIPPISHKMMEVSNVAFFPAYPLISSAVQHVFHLTTDMFKVEKLSCYLECRCKAIQMCSCTLFVRAYAAAAPWEWLWLNGALRSQKSM